MALITAWLDDEHLLFIGKQGTKRGQLWELHVAEGTVRERGIDGLWLRDQLVLSLARNSVAVTAVGEHEHASGAPRSERAVRADAGDTGAD
jgi:hypothetical protein